NQCDRERTRGHTIRISAHMICGMNSHANMLGTIDQIPHCATRVREHQNIRHQPRLPIAVAVRFKISSRESRKSRSDSYAIAPARDSFRRPDTTVYGAALYVDRPTLSAAPAISRAAFNVTRPISAERANDRIPDCHGS